jgi:hypothetical protein
VATATRPAQRKDSDMNKSEIERVQAYLRRLFGCDRIRVVPPAKAGLAVEIAVDDEVVGTIYRDAEEGEVSYSVHLTILEEDLPPPKAEPMPTRGRAR